MYNRSWAHQGPQSMDAIKRFNANLKRFKDNDGIMIGYHGTSGSMGKVIEQEGFKNYKSIDGTVGVWFWEDKFQSNAGMAGEKKAKELKEDEYAVIKAELTKPDADFSPYARPIWRAQKDKIKILGIEYVKVGEDPKYNF
ncbi:hypothetical protein ACFL1H_06770 [Nanoarchaeota archaeon]